MTQELTVSENNETNYAVQLASLILTEGYGGIDHILEMLDEQPSFENAATYLAFLTGLENTSKWGIGEIIYFLRHRFSYVTEEVYPYSEGETFPDDLYAFLKKRFGGFDLRQALASKKGTIAGFLGWKVFRFDRFWLLVGKGEIRVWVKVKDEVTDDEWAETVAGQLTPIVSKLNDRTAWAYYATVARLPDRDERVEELSWTYYYELGNLKGNDVPPSIRGDDRHEEIRKLMLPQVEKDITDGSATVPNVRARIAQKNREKRGFVFNLPPIWSLYIEDPETEKSFEALHISDPQFQEYILFQTKLATRDLPPRVSIEYNDKDGLIYIEGREVGYITHREEPVVRAAVDHLVNRLRWSIKE